MLDPKGIHIRIMSTLKIDLWNSALDATPISSLPLNKLLSVEGDFSLLQMLDRFQEGRSHMAVVTRMSKAKAASVKLEVKKGLTQRLKEKVKFGDSDSSGEESDSETVASADAHSSQDGSSNDSHTRKLKWGRRRKHKKANKNVDLEKGEGKPESKEGGPEKPTAKTAWEKITINGREQSMPDDAVLPEDGADEVR